ncbi:MAG: Ppx/GppA family phosphatase [Bacteroidales bacterium]|nr:Ppx/GppA family phosphatase [Bacteroidales bacterium]
MTAAIIDCGTNTFNLLVADIQVNEGYKILLNTKKSVKLGEGGMPDNKIAKKPFERGIKTFIELVKIAKKYKAESIHAFATSAVRSTLNGPEFVKKIQEKTGIIIQVLNGDTEAQYIYKGVRLSLDNLPQPILIMDIGGGSTEFIIASEDQVLWKRSFDLGASRLIQQFQPSDPLTPEQEKNLKEHFRDMLKPLNTQLKKHQVDTLIGCSGSFESLADMIKAEKNDNQPLGDIYNFDYGDFKNLHQKLIASTEAERKAMPGLVEYRADTIVFASIFIRFVKKRHKIKNMTYSGFALKEGVLADLISGRIAL